MSPAKDIGGTPAALHLDITRSTVINDNSFQVELTLLVDNSINIHGDEVRSRAPGIYTTHLSVGCVFCFFRFFLFEILVTNTLVRSS